MEKILQVNDLNVSFPAAEGRLQAVCGVSFSLAKGEMLALVGESGSGKSVTAKAVMGLLPGNASCCGEIIYGGRNLLQLSERDRQKLRGSRLGIILQDPLSSLDPTMPVGRQIGEVLRLKGESRKTARQEAVRLMTEVGITDAQKRFKQYPFAFSGGMRQRIVIAAALAAEPDILICDEPTSALDVTIQTQILEMLRRLKAERGLSVIFITHDLGIAAGMADRVAVMQGGRLLECEKTETLMAHPSHPYTRRLLAAAFGRAVTDEEKPAEASGEPGRGKKPLPEQPDGSPDVLLRVEHLGKSFGAVKVLDDVSLFIRRGEVYGLVGESGSGKTTAARCIAGLYAPTEGRIDFRGKDPQSGGIQMIFQDPAASLDPRMTVGDSIAEGLVIRGGASKEEIRKRVLEMMALVGLPAEHAMRYPHELSGGQRQRVGIARAAVLQPELIIADEPVSALDAPIRAQIISLLRNLKERFGMAVLFIAHDLSAVRDFSDRIGVMHGGRLVEEAAAAELFNEPLHPYTRLLLSALPQAEQAPEMPGNGPSRDAGMLSTDGDCRFLEARPGHFVLCGGTDRRITGAGEP